MLAKIEPSAERRKVGGDSEAIAKAACPVVVAGIVANHERSRVTSHRWVKKRCIKNFLRQAGMQLV